MGVFNRGIKTHHMEIPKSWQLKHCRTGGLTEITIDRGFIPHKIQRGREVTCGQVIKSAALLSLDPSSLWAQVPLKPYMRSQRSFSAC